MLSGDDRRAAAELARALDGDPGAVDEARRLAHLLSGAAVAARVEVPVEEMERALARAQASAAPVRRRPARRRLLVAGVAVAALVAVALVPLVRSSSPLDIEARAAGAVDRLAVLHVVSRISSPTGVIPGGGLTSWTDHRGGQLRVHLTRTDSAGVAAVEILSTPGSYVRYQPGTNSAVVGPSCRIVASGCAELLDPVELYRQALLRFGIANADKVSVGGRVAYRFRLPLPGVAQRPGIYQVVTIDGETFLPRSIAWRDRTGTVAVITPDLVEQVAPDALPSQVFQLAIPAGVHVRQVDAQGDEVRLLGARTVSLAALRASGIATAWLGREVEGQRLRRIEIVRFTGGVAVRYRYNRLIVWSYDQVIPPELRAGHLSPTKILDDGPSPAHFYVTADGRAVAERDLPEVTVSVIEARFTKLDVLLALQQARPLS